MSEVCLLQNGVHYSFPTNKIWKKVLNVVFRVGVDNLVLSRNKCLSVLAMILNCC
jgi:hypothetical protein